ncbi:hypothetical protein I3842_07G236000 [Carya illinoinensis]|uniref:Reverse transcriptase n=1 Tax=Carya illinoinensis TaxID=32201 RepID=A0A922JGR4_CARIL|nr:hypothetical protein I3842_07G236000 [Carya illinoinensis]
MWDKRVVNLVEDFVREFSLACSFSNVDDDFVWGFAGVYGPNDDSSRKLLWDELAGLCCWWDIPWCIGGDFNITRFPSEWSGVSNLGSAMADFSALLFDLNLVDLPLAGGDFTWSNERAWSRLDRFVVSPFWETHFPNLCQKRLPRLCSDHFSILLDCGGLQEGRRYFKFENMWLKVDGFVEKIHSWWASYLFTGSPSFILAGKLKALNNDLRKWNLEVFGHIKDQRDKLFTELQQLDEREVDMTSSLEDRTRRLVVLAELEKITLMEEITWRQKSRALWLKEGDRSTKFFHRVANSHRRNNAIEVLHEEGRIISGRDEIKNHVVHSFEKLLTEQYLWRPKTDGLAFDSIDHTTAAWLERPFEENEVLGVIKGMNKDKAPGPDGFQWLFFTLVGKLLKRTS